MKILHIVPTYWPAYSRGGPIWSVHLLNRWLVKKGIDVTVYTTDIDIKELVELEKPANVDGVEVRYFPATFKRWEYSWKLHKKLAETVQDFDLIHITSVFLSALTLGAHYARKHNKPYIISPRGSLMKETIRKNRFVKKLYISLIDKRNLAGAAGIHFTTELERKDYIDLGLYLNKSIVIPNGLDLNDVKTQEHKDVKTSFRNKFSILPDRKIVLFLSRINWKKGFDTLIPAFAEVLKKEPKALLVIAGGDDENYRKEVELQIVSHQLQDKIVFTGMLLGEEKIAAYKEASVFVLPSYAENFAMVVVEAMYFRVPVVITNRVGIAPYIKSANAGIVINKNKDELVRAILEILDRPKKAQKMGKNGRELVKKRFGIEKVAKNWIDAYNKLLK